MMILFSNKGQFIKIFFYKSLYLKEEFPKDMGVMIGNCEYIKDMTGKDNLKYLASLLKKIY